jgi:hypothetical protein
MRSLSWSFIDLLTAYNIIVERLWRVSAGVVELYVGTGDFSLADQYSRVGIVATKPIDIRLIAQ